MAITLNMATTLTDLRPGEKWMIKGDHLTYANLTWLDATTKPTQTELETAELAAAKADRKSTVDRECKDKLDALYPTLEQNFAALGSYDTTYEATKTVTDATNASPIVVTATGHGYLTGDKVTTASIGGNNAANVSDNAITVLTANTYELDGTTGDGAYTSGGTSKRQKGLAVRNHAAKITSDAVTAKTDIDALGTVSAVTGFTW